MEEMGIHPSIKAFKEFAHRHPGLVAEVRKSGGDWQEYYEKWVLLGEDDPVWNKYKKEQLNTKNGRASTEKDQAKQEAQQDTVQQFMKMIENVDLNKVQGHMEQLNGAISNIQKLVGQFQDLKKQHSRRPGNTPPFPFYKD